MDLAEACYRLLVQFPPDEIDGLAAQVRRCAVAVPANVADGCEAESTAAYLRSLLVAQGSLAALETHLILAEQTGTSGAAATRRVLDRCEAVGKTLARLIRSIQRHGGGP
jgi:four helix bundle protein